MFANRPDVVLFLTTLQHVNPIVDRCAMFPSLRELNPPVSNHEGPYLKARRFRNVKPPSRRSPLFDGQPRSNNGIHRHHASRSASNKERMLPKRALASAAVSNRRCVCVCVFDFQFISGLEWEFPSDCCNSLRRRHVLSLFRVTVTCRGVAEAARTGRTRRSCR